MNQAELAETRKLATCLGEFGRRSSKRSTQGQPEKPVEEKREGLPDPWSTYCGAVAGRRCWTQWKGSRLHITGWGVG